MQLYQQQLRVRSVVWQQLSYKRTRQRNGYVYLEALFVNEGSFFVYLSMKKVRLKVGSHIQRIYSANIDLQSSEALPLKFLFWRTNLTVGF